MMLPPRPHPLRHSRPGRLRRSLVVASLSALVLAGCGGDRSGAAGGDGPPSGEHRLVEGSGPGGAIPLATDAPITLLIDGGQWGGTAACNTYGGTVEVDGQDLSVREVFQTDMACLDDTLMRAERAYLDAFMAVDRYEHDDGGLILRGDETELVFEAVAPAEDAALLGTTWELTSLLEGAGGDGAGDDGAVSSVMGAPTLRFAEDGTFRAGTGCADLAGSFEQDGETLTTLEVDRETAACPDATASAQDEHVLDVLSDRELRLTLEGDSLRLLTPDGRGLDYRAGP